MTDDGLPMGVQLVAPQGREDVLIRIASQLEEARRGPTGAPRLGGRARRDKLA